MDKNLQCLFCLFCYRSSQEVKKLIVKNNSETKDSISTSICDICIEKCYDILQKELIDLKDVEETMPEIETTSPKNIKKYLDEYLEGQEEAKITISVAIYNHYKRINRLLAKNVKSNNTTVEKSNIIMVGPSGCGKTFMTKIIANILSVPYVMVDATTITESGYAGDDVESVLSKLLQAANFDVARAEVGIIYIDEVDKIAKKETHNTRDISGEGVQQGLLTILEGIDVNVSIGGKRSLHSESVQMNTSNILFICGGAFPKLKDIIKQRINKKVYSLGEVAPARGTLQAIEENKYYMHRVNNEDFEKFGMIREFINRFSSVAIFDELTEDQLFTLLKFKKNSFLRQYEKTFEASNIDLQFTDEAIRLIIMASNTNHSGLRGLRRSLEKLLRDEMFYLFSEEKKEKFVLLIDAQMVKSKLSEELDYYYSQNQKKNFF